MKLEDKIYVSIGLTVFLTIAYYYAYSFVELYISKLCDKYVCFEFPPYADFFAIWVAIVGLYFVVTSLDAWKNQYKFQEAIKTCKEFDKAPLILEQLLGEFYQLINDCKKYNYGDMYGAISDFDQMYESKNLSMRIFNINELINHNKNNLYQDDFENLLNDFNIAINDMEHCISEANLNESNYSNDAKYNLAIKKEKIRKVEEGFEKFRKRYKKFIKNYSKLKLKLNL